MIIKGVLGLLVWALLFSPMYALAQTADSTMAVDSVVIPLLKAMTYDIHHDHPSDVNKGNGWEKRKILIRNLLHYHRPDVVGLQSADEAQVKYLAHELPEYAWTGVGKEDGDKKGEFSPIFYNTAVLELMSGGHFWLSETPEKPSKGWDAQHKRMVTYAKFRRKDTRQEFWFFNAQFDQKGEKARTESAKLLKIKVQQLSGNLPAIVGGNFHSSDENEPYLELTRELQSNNQRGGQAFSLVDAFKTTKTQPQGLAGTNPGFEVTIIQGKRVDFLLVKPSVTVEKHTILPDSNNGKHPSDHVPVLIEISF